MLSRSLCSSVFLGVWGPWRRAPQGSGWQRPQALQALLGAPPPLTAIPSRRRILKNSLCLVWKFSSITVSQAFVGALRHCNGREFLWSHEACVFPRPPSTTYNDIMVPWWHPKVAPWCHLATILGWYAQAMLLMHYWAVLLQHQGAKSVSGHEAMRFEF